MLIRVKKNWQDLVEGPKHTGLSRRDFLARGLATGFLSFAVPDALAKQIIKAAGSGSPLCSTLTQSPGAIAQIYASGGPTMGARFFSDQQAKGMNTATATNYGISGTNLLRLGPNFNIDSTSVFGYVLLQGPPGFVGGPSAWQSQVLNNCCGGGHLGPFNADDGAGLNSGLIGSVSQDKSSLLGKDVYFNPGPKRALWTNGTPALYINNPSPANLEAPFVLHPTPSSPATAALEMKNAADGAVSIAQALAPMLGTNKRKGSSNMMAASCSFYGNAALTDPAYGSKMFDPTNISALTNSMTVGSLTAQEKALASAFYQSATGTIGGVTLTFGGRDYHGLDPATQITPVEVEDARSVVMFLAACFAAQQPGALIYLSNGQAIANGVQGNITTTINGITTQPMNCPKAMGDAGGLYNAGLMIFYNPKGNLPVARFTGTVSAVDGSVRMDPNVGSAQNALAGLFLSAHTYISGSMPKSLLARLQANNIAPDPSSVTIV